MFTPHFAILVAAALWIVFLTQVLSTKTPFATLLYKVLPLSLAALLVLMAFKVI